MVSTTSVASVRSNQKRIVPLLIPARGNGLGKPGYSVVVGGFSEVFTTKGPRLSTVSAAPDCARAITRHLYERLGVSGSVGTTVFVEGLRIVCTTWPVALRICTSYVSGPTGGDATSDDQ